MLEVSEPNSPIIINWSETTKWTSTSGLLRYGDLPSGWKLHGVGELLEEVAEPEKVSPDAEYDLAGVKWYGEGVFHRETVRGKEQSASKLFHLVPGALIYNRLFAWKASFALVGETDGHMYVSTEFPQFIVKRPDLVLPEYLYLALITTKLQRAVGAASIGSAAVSRNRFKEDDFLDFRIPVPPLALQHSIVAKWQEAQSEIKELNSQVVEQLRTLDDCLRSKTDKFEETASSKSFVASSAKTMQWDIKAGRAAAFIEANPSFVRLGEFTQECVDTVKPWEQPEKEWPLFGVNNTDGVFLNSYQIGSKFNAAYKRIEKSWFFHNPTRANVGSLGMVPDVPADAITSPEYQVWRLESGFLPEFMALLIKTDYFLTLVEFNRVGGVKQRMYYSNLAEIRLPMVPIEEQKRVSDQYTATVQKISDARANLHRRKTAIDEMITGTMNVEGN